jgi:hypothetical protein
MEDGMTVFKTSPFLIIVASSPAHANQPNVLLVSKCYLYQHFFLMDGCKYTGGQSGIAKG